MKGRSKRILVALLAGVMLLASPLGVKAVKPSGVEYSMTIKQSTDFFIGNEKAINAMNGEEMYLVYTVKSVDEKETTSYQHGIIGTDNTSIPYPYAEGGVLNYNMKACLLEEGYTYFYKFMVVDGKLDCIVTKAKGDDRQLISFAHTYGEATDNYKYFGIWFGCGNVTAKLTHMMCYDSKGNDLGIGGANDNKIISYDRKVPHAYSVSGSKINNLAISSAKKTDAEVIYMEYTVDKADAKLYQNGVISTAAPKDAYPHNSGFLSYEMFKDNPGHGYLLEEGASYLIRFERQEDKFSAKVQKAKNGTAEMYSFPLMWGAYDAQAPYVSLWFGEGGDYYVSLELSNMKCYDENGNNLGIQTNQQAARVTHYGEMEEYANAESVYYEEKTGNVVALYEDKTAKVTRDGKTEEITYQIRDGILYLVFEDGKETYDYLYQKFRNDDASYERLGTFYATFVTGTEDAPKKQTINEETGYTVMKPENPKRKDAEFEGWVLADGTEYDFDSLVTKSLALYAKWSDGIAYEQASSTSGNENAALYIAIAVNAVLIAGGATAAVLIRRKNKR